MKLIQLLLLLLITNIIYATNTNISGVVNTYDAVSSVATNSITLNSASAHSYVCGDRLMLIQMKGATINTVNTAAFGNISSIGNAGNYEMATVTSVSGTTITFSENLSKTYDVAGLVQAIYVPHYEDATVTATLTAQAWDGATGGVLAIEVDGTLTMNADIDVSQLGFRGGDYHPNTQPSPSSYVCLNLGFFQLYEENVGMDFRYNAANKSYAVEKGESISTNSTYLWGKGKFISGGGGGGVESGGGGGGANYGAGGNGADGNPLSSACNNPDVAGLGGIALSAQINTDKIFLGGGSGAGCNGNVNGYYTAAQNTLPAIGRNGGGIIYVSSNTIVANGNSILANGENGYVETSTTIDNFGGSGGGAGGSILLDTDLFQTVISIEANGGYGTTVRTNNTGARRRAAGGGGGGGVVAFASATATASVDGGDGGLSYSSGSTLRSSHYGVAGGNGAVISAYSIPGTEYKGASLTTATTTKTDFVLGSNYHYISDNGILVAINPNTNDLGSTIVTTTVGGASAFPSVGCSEDELYLPRVVEVVPTTQPTSACDVSLFMTSAELTAFMAQTAAQSANYKSCWGEVTGVSDLVVTVVHPNGANEALIPTITYDACTDIYRLDVQVNEFSTFYIHSNKGTLSGNLLPVEWLSFDADYISEEEVELKWTTGVEINNDGFFVERSYDGENFEEIDWVNGQGNINSKTDYTYLDYIDIYKDHSNVYYRLNQMDYNGEQEYSKIVALKLKTYNFIGELYPNPTYSQVSIDVINNTDAVCNITIYNTIGKLVYQKIAKTSSKSLSKVDIEIESLNAGIYTCVLEINGEKTIRRLVKK